MNKATVTIDGSVMTVVEVRPDGGKVYITAIDSSQNLLVIEKSKDFTGFGGVKGYTRIGTSAVAA
jgi:DNA-binding beta-propeller fold protein YncE